MIIKLQIPNYPPIINNNVELIFGEKDSFLIIHGPNGCGKSTLLHILLGLKKSDGIPKVVIDDDEVYSTIDFKETVRYLPQNPEDGLFSRLSVEDNLSLLRKLLNIKDPLTNHYVDDENKCLGLLSVGEKRNLLLDAILKSLPPKNNFGNKPLILLLDEPFAGLDINNKEVVFEKILNISQEYEGSSLKFLIIDHQNIKPEEISRETEITLRKGIIFKAIQCKSIKRINIMSI